MEGNVSEDESMMILPLNKNYMIWSMRNKGP